MDDQSLTSCDDRAGVRSSATDSMAAISSRNATRPEQRGPTYRSHQSKRYFTGPLQVALIMPTNERNVEFQRRFVLHLEPIKASLAAYARQVAWNSCDWEDILQAALTTAFTGFSQFQEVTNFSAWMFKHLQHAAWNHNRRRNSLTAPQQELTEATETCSVSAAEQEIAYTQLMSDPHSIYEHFDDRVRSALMALSESERVALLLRSIADFNYKEIAEIMDIPVGTVMSHLCRAREKMKERLIQFAEKSGWRNFHKGNIS